MANESAPVVGGAFRLEGLKEQLAWVMEAQRDVEIQDTSNPELFEGDWRALAREINTVLDGHTGRRGLHAPYEGINVAVPDPRVAGAIADRLLQTLEFAAEVGGTHCVLHSPFLFFGTAQMVHRPDERAGAFARIQRNLERVVEAAAAIRCVLVFENICDLSPEPLDGLVRDFDSPWVRRSLDTGHANLMRPRGAPPADAWVRAAGILLEHVHLADNDGETDRHWAPGLGQIEWRSFFRELAQLEQSPRLILEVSPANQRLAYAWLSERGLVR